MSFLDHRTKHTKEKRYECLYPSCGKRFHTPIALKYHMARHSDERNYPCEWPGCESRFKTDDGMA